MSTVVLHKVQANYQTQVANYETQVTATATLIGKLKKEKDPIEEKSEMSIRRIWLIIRGWWERLHQKFEENVAAIWAQCVGHF